MQSRTHMADNSFDYSFLRAAVDTIPFSVAILDDSGKIHLTNRKWRKFAQANGMPEHYSTLEKDYLQITRDADDEYSDQAEEGLLAVLSGEQSVFELEYPCHGPEKNRWFRLYAAGFSIDKDRYATVAHIDITERREREAAARLFRRAVHNAGHGVYITDREGTIEYTNPAFERITGYDSNEAIGQRPSILKSGAMNEEYYEDLWATITEGSIWHEVVENRQKSGETYYADQTIAPFPPR